MTNGNGQTRDHVEVLDAQFRPVIDISPPPTPRKRPVWPALTLFLLTIVSTLAVGSEFARSYAQGEQPFSQVENYGQMFVYPLTHPRLLLLGVPFSLTLLTILLAHELGHYFACKIYGIDASYPYFIPAPTLIGTMGAFIRIRSPIANRKALFDVGLAGPVVGFLFAVPALAAAIAYSKVVPGAQGDALLVFGNPPLMKIFMAVLRPGVTPDNLLLHPVGRAAWVGLFATALNLLPAGQLDGGHIVYSVASEKHRRISLAVVVVLLLLGGPALLHSMGVAMPRAADYFWPGWAFWGLLLLMLGFRHPPLLDRWEPLDEKRRAWAVVGLLIFLLCFTPTPFAMH